MFLFAYVHYIFNAQISQVEIRKYLKNVILVEFVSLFEGVLVLKKFRAH